MKTACIAVLATGAFASDVAPPRIELNLGSDLLAGHTSAHGWGYPAVDYSTGTWYDTSAGNFAASNAPKVRQCVAKKDGESSCAEPKCRAFDWQDKHAHKDCHIEYYLVNNDNLSMDTPVKHSQLNYNLRSEWLITYDAEDASGNKAKQASFTMIMEDKLAPGVATGTAFILPYSEVGGSANYLQAGAGGMKFATLDNELTATDNYDDQDSVRNTLVLSVTSPDSASDFANRATTANSPHMNYGYTPVTTTHGYGDVVKLDTLKVGTYHLKYEVHDQAGMYGQGGKDNVSIKYADIQVHDTVKPVITITDDHVHDAPAEAVKDHGDHTHATWTGAFHECATPYTDAHAVCKDDRDSYEAEHTLNDSMHVDHEITDGKVHANYVSTNKITYKCHDREENHADNKVRTIEVRDTTAPTLRITTVHNDILDRYGHKDGLHDDKDGNGDAIDTAKQASYDEHWVIQHTAGFAADMKYIQRLQQDGDGYSCSDTCGTQQADGTLVEPSTTVVTSWHKDTCSGAAIPFNTEVPGVYVLKYHCTDAHEQTVTKCRTVRNEDKFKPVLTILGRDVMTLEATTTGNYVDDGATCSDATDGEIPASVEVSGDVVKLANIGEYLVQYNCRDAAGNQAEPATRTVIVKQSWGAVTMGAIIDVSFPLLCEKKQFALRIGCAEAAGVDTAAVTAQVSEFCGSDQHGKYIARTNRRRLAGCTCVATALETCKQNGNVKVDFTIAVPNAVEANRLVAVLGDDAFPDALLKHTNAALLRIKGVTTDDDECLGPINGPIITEPVGCANSVTCKMNGSPQTSWEAGYPYVDQGVACTDELDGTIPEAQIYASSTVDVDATGVYHVTYEAINSQGTWNYGFNYDTCAYVRTVTIVDTLKPIIEVKYGDEVVKRTEALDISSVSGQANKANVKPSSEIWSLMAEESSVTSNSWLLAAAGSAVTGLALLAFSRKQAAVTVPV
jgi:hypothetical protein